MPRTFGGLSRGERSFSWRKKSGEQRPPQDIIKTILNDECLDEICRTTSTSKAIENGFGHCGSWMKT